MTIRAVVWGENIHEQTNKVVAEIYPEGMHNTIAKALNADAGIQATTATLQEPEHGLSEARLKDTDVLLWWGHKDHGAVKDEVVERVAKRVHWKVPPETDKLVRDAAATEDLKKASDLWVEYQKKVVDEAVYFVLFQPIYQIAVRDTLAKLPLTASGWQLDMADVKPA